MTFDLWSSARQKPLRPREPTVYETFGVCRNCKKTTTFRIKAPGRPPEKFPDAVPNALNVEPVSMADVTTRPSPEHVPDRVLGVFEEGTKCLAIKCCNAAALMFRSALDIATQDLLSKDDAECPKGTERNLGPRLDWMFENNKLPERLRDLASVVKDDGNDAAHRGTIDEVSAVALVEFTERLLTEVYTEPEKIRLALERSRQRKEKSGE